MNEIRPEYSTLFNAITNAIEILQALKDDLIHAQQEAEDMYIARMG